jgi:hypothetical protein
MLKKKEKNNIGALLNMSSCVSSITVAGLLAT